jgi:protein disulfide-isomerase A6
MGVKGYPTLKIVRPSKRKGGKPMVEDYQSERSTKAIVDAVIEKIPNHVKRVTDKSIESWLKESNETAKAVLLTEKGTTSALLRALAIDFLGSVNVGQIKNKEKEAVEIFGIEKFPTFLVLPGGEADAVVYDGELKKENMKDFLAKFAEPNLDPPPVVKKKQPVKKEGEKVAESTVKVGDKVKESTEKKKSPVAPITTLDEAKLKTECLSSTSKVCVLLLLPEKQKEPSQKLLEAMVNILEIHDKHSRRAANFPFYIIEATNPSSKLLRETLGLKGVDNLEVIAVNAKRMWWRHHAPGEEEGYTHNGLEAWVDTIRMNEGKRETLPKELITEVNDDDEEDEEKSDVVEESKTESTTASASSGQQEEKIRDEL